MKRRSIHFAIGPTVASARNAGAALNAVGSGIPLGLVPGGTGNLLVGNLRLPRDPAAAARVILTGRTAAIDLGSVERADGTHYFAVCGGTGFDAQHEANAQQCERADQETRSVCLGSTFWAHNLASHENE